MPCLGHNNNFRHLEIDLGELNDRVDLGYKFEHKENANPPYLILYISLRKINDLDATSSTPPSLKYGLNRQEWENISVPGEEENNTLLNLTNTYIPDAVRDW